MLPSDRLFAHQQCFDCKDHRNEFFSTFSVSLKQKLASSLIPLPLVQILSAKTIKFFVFAPLLPCQRIEFHFDRPWVAIFVDLGRRLIITSKFIYFSRRILHKCRCHSLLIGTMTSRMQPCVKLPTSIFDVVPFQSTFRRKWWPSHSRRYFWMQLREICEEGSQWGAFRSQPGTPASVYFDHLSFRMCLWDESMTTQS